MQQSNQKEYPPLQTYDIDLRKIFNPLLARKLFIFGLTAFVTLLGIIYALNITPIYKTSSLFISPSDSSIMSLNRHYSSFTKKSVFANYLTLISSKDFQKKVFLDGGYLTVFGAQQGKP